jgi:hypothetical protein
MASRATASQAEECDLACIAGLNHHRIPVLKKTRYGVDKQEESKMLPVLTTVSLPQTYCRCCHLSTRSDRTRCLHCNQLLQAPPVIRQKVLRRTAKHSSAIRASR